MDRNSFFTRSYEKLYDPVQQTIKTIPYIKKIYGPQIHKQLVKETLKAQSLRKDTPGKAFSAQLVSSMRKTCVELFPDSGFDTEKPLDDHKLKLYQDFFDFNEVKPEVEEADAGIQKEIQKKRQPGDDFFFMFERGIIRNPEFRKMFKSKFVLWAWMWANIVREGWIDKKGYPIKERYYDRGYLAYCASYRQLAKDCFMSKETVQTYIHELAEDRSIKLEFIVPEGKKQKQGVYILGEWKKVDEQISERFYLDHTFLEAKKDSPWYFKVENFSPESGQ